MTVSVLQAIGMVEFENGTILRLETTFRGPALYLKTWALLFLEWGELAALFGCKKDNNMMILNTLILSLSYIYISLLSFALIV